MGSCLSKKGSSSSHTCSPAAVVAAPPLLPDLSSEPEHEEEPKKTVQAEESVKKEIFVIKQRKSHERRPEEKGAGGGGPAATTTTTEICSNGNANGGIIAPITIRTSSCTKEEVDAILIQCGRLSRSSSGKAGGGSCDNGNPNGLLVSGGSRKHLGRKRSYDFDQDDSSAADKDDDDRRQSRPSHRRTPSREREADYKRSGSREERRRGSGGGGRKVSRSPGRRSETPNAPANPPVDKSGPGKMVSVPASVSTRDKSNSAPIIPESATGIKRVNAKRSGASPRSQSPANARVSSDPQQPSLSRNSSRKAEHSPYRRNPLTEMDQNEQFPSKTLDQIHSNNRGRRNKESEEEGGIAKKPSNSQSQKLEERNNNNNNNNNSRAVRDKEQQIVEDPLLLEAKRVPAKSSDVAVRRESTGVEITRSRSSRRSRDLDLNPTTYASLLLEDIQNFHQQNTTAFSLPHCVTKACSILEAVADLNSCTSSNLSPVFSEDRMSGADHKKKKVYNPNAKPGKRRLESKDPFVESEVVVSDDLMEPSFHKYVTVRRGEMEQQESSGSNSFVDQHWASSSSSWEPNSADSTECSTREEKHGLAVEGATVILCERKRDIDEVGIGCGKGGARRGGHSIPPIAAASM